jgi:hypothetical protein
LLWSWFALTHCGKSMVLKFLGYLHNKLKFNYVFVLSYLFIWWHIRESIYYMKQRYSSLSYIQGGSNMTGTDCGLFTHKSVPVIFESPCIIKLFCSKEQTLAVLEQKVAEIHPLASLCLSVICQHVTILEPRN